MKAAPPEPGETFQQALALHQRGQLAAARTRYEEVLLMRPDHFDALHLLGVIAYQANDPAKAADLIGRALQLDPSRAEAFFNRALALKSLGLTEAALASYDHAIALQGDYADAHFNRGNLLREVGQLDAALASYERVIALKPGHAQAHLNRSSVLRDLKRFDAALSGYLQTLAVKPDYTEAHMNRSDALLALGHFEEGFKEYEWRWKSAAAINKQRHFPQPLWLGKESLQGKTILLHREQGLGDTIQFCRYVSLVADLGARVLLEVQDSLAPLLADLRGVTQMVAAGQALPHFDYQCPLMSLPMAFKTTIDSIPGASGYLRSDAGRVAQWQSLLGVKTRPRIGLVWSGNAQIGGRNIALAELMRYLPAEFQYMSLQKELRESDRPTLASLPNLIDHASEFKDFRDTAALCKCMDLVVSVDTSVAHLCGSLGVRTWVLLPFKADWRWHLDRDDSPWYASVKLYRQNRKCRWDDVLQRVSEDLSVEFHQRGQRVHGAPATAP